MYLFFDVETTGFGHKDRVTQLAFALCAKDGNVLYEYESLIKPDGWVIPKEEFFIENGMSTERCELHGKPAFGVFRQLQDNLKKSQYKIAHNIQFDNRFVLNELKLLGITHQLFQFKKSICTMRKTQSIPGIKKNHGSGGKFPSLNDLHFYCFGEDIIKAHDALNDVRAMYRSFFKLKELGFLNEY